MKNVSTSIVVCSLIASIFLLSGCAEENTSAEPVPPRVRFFVVGDKATGQSRRLSGKVIAQESSPLSFRVGGTVSEVFVQPGDRVNKGQVLALLQKRDFQIALNQARAAVNVARAAQEEARQNFSRAERLYEQDAGSQAEVEQAQAGRAAAEGELQSALSALEQTRRDLAGTSLQAPFEGTIATRTIEPFSEIAAGAESFVLQSSGAFEVEVLVPETLVRDLDYGQTVGVSFPTLPELKLTGTVNEISSRTESGNAFPVIIQLNTANSDLRAGISAAVTFNFSQYLGEKTAFLIPISALALEAGMHKRYQSAEAFSQHLNSPTAPIFVINENNVIELREVTVGDLRGNQLEVFSGLAAGDKIVSAGVAFLHAGMHVKLWRAELGLDDG